MNTLRESIIGKLPEFTSELSSSLESQSTVTDAFNSSLFGNALHEDIIPGLLENLRDVKRFTNFLSISIRPIESEIIFEDYFYISLIRYKYPDLVKYIKKFKKTFFDAALENRRLPKPDEISKALRILKIDRLEKELITKLFDYLYTGRNSKQQKSISNFLKFDIYFDNDISTQSILYGDFLAVLGKPWGELRIAVSSWIDKGKSLALSDIIRHLDVFESRLRFENVVKIWIYLIDFGPSKDFVVSYFIDFTGHNRGAIIPLYESHFELETFFDERFRITSDCFFTTTFVLRDVLRKYIDKTEGFYFPLSEDRARTICTTRLLQFVGTRTKFDVRVFNLFYYNCWAGFSNGRQVVLTAEANTCVLEHVTKFPEDYLRWTIRPKSTPMIDGFYAFEPFTNQYFDGWDKFELFLKSKVMENDEFGPLLKYFYDFKVSGFQHFFSDEIPKWLEVIDGNAINRHFKDQTALALAHEYYS
jgi:hypothetical protein